MNLARFESLWTFMRNPPPLWLAIACAGAALGGSRQAGCGARSSATSPANVEAVVRNDPPLGSSISLSGLGQLTTRAAGVLMISPCACNPELLAGLVPPPGTQLIVAVVGAKPAEALNRISVRRGVHVVADPDFEMQRALNAGFLPRLYRIDRHGRLDWKLDRLASWQEIERMVRELGKHTGDSR